VHFTVDGTPLATTVTAGADGSWTYTLTGLHDGQHTIVASETDGAGNIGTASLTFNLDTTAPTVSSVTDTGAGINAGTGLVGIGATVHFALNMNESSIVVPDSSGHTASLSLSDGGTATFNAGLSHDGTLIFDYTVQSGHSSADLAVVGVANGATITDLAGNPANLMGAVTNPTGVLRVDGIAPTIAMNNNKSAEVVSGNQKNVTFNWHASDNTGGSGLDHFVYWVDTHATDSGAPTNASSLAASTISATMAYSSALKGQYFHVEAVDHAGNVSTFADWHIV
jgi:hypothetical protein